MKIGVLSGKGGTGKTLVSVNLAAASKRARYIDCDVEEPNGHLFFKPSNVVEEKVTLKIPVVDHTLCDGCRQCVSFCKFNALAYIKNNVIVFDDVCHSCGGCTLVCPRKAISEKDKTIGTIQKGISKEVDVWTGILNTGEASGTAIIHQLLEDVPSDELTIIDCPPGSACVVMESIKDVDYCILVAEPTIFGVSNLAMVHELVTLFNKPFGVVLNKCVDGETVAEDYCLKHNIRVLCRIPFEKKLGTINSNADIAAYHQEYNDLFTTLLDTVIKEVHHETTINS